MKGYYFSFPPNYFLCSAMDIVFKIFLACAAIQLLYYLLVFLRLNFVRPIKGIAEILPPVSVIICAKNEARNLQQFLKIVLIQQYKQFEVIVVNDQSDDNTIDVLVEYYKRNKNLKIIDIPKNTTKLYAGKKYALMKGLEAATFETVVVTDADCRPATTHWLATLTGTYLEETQIVLGHSPYEERPGFLNKVIRYENFMTAIQYFGFAKAGLPYMGVGRNMSYKKNLVKGFKGYDKGKDMLTGDDDLFINAVANRGNTEICIDKAAFMWTEPEKTFNGWLNQKKRHLRSGFRYKFIHRLLLFLFALSGFVFYATIIALLVHPILLKPLLAVFFSIVLLKFITTFSLYKKLGMENLRFISPILDVTYSGYLLIIFLLLLLKPKDSWKT